MEFSIKKTSFFLLLATASPLFGDATVSHDQDYFTNNQNNVQIIYTKKNLPVAERAASLEGFLHAQYEKQFGFALDERLYVGLISDYNQIANGFSTPLPNNRQINYIGGTELVDYFSVRSWLETLIYHETAHNYQLNAKDNTVSRSLHTVFGNGTVISPFFTLPNIGINSFILEGNAVLNESWHGNGGRLYSGRFRVQNLLQVKSGYFTPERMHNDTLFFPYGEHYYTMGGFFQYYLAEKYGMERTNRFFKENSAYWYWPFFTNSAMENTVGRNFESAVRDYAKSARSEAESVMEAKGDVLVRSKYFSPLNGDRNEVYFLVSPEGVRAPELARFNLKSKKLTLRRGGYMGGKVIKAGGDYFTQGGNYTNPFRIYQGLFDKNAVILNGTQSKMIQGFLNDGTPVYFDVPTSFDHPRLFVGKTFYADVHSSVFIDRDDNLYYFVQEGKTRTLFKNKSPLYSYQGYYGIVSDVDADGSVYFIANSPLGSTLYRRNPDKTIHRVSGADNIVDARLVSATHALLAATSADDYYYCIAPLSSGDQPPFETILFFEKNPPPAPVSDPKAHRAVSLDLTHPYHSFLDMHYSGTNFSFGNDVNAGWIYDLQIVFEDPLGQNALTALASRNTDEVSLVGVGYENTQTFVRTNIVGFGVTEKNAAEQADSYRDFGFGGEASIPWLQKGYWSGNLNASYQQDYASHQREPLGLTLALSESEQFGHSLYENSAFYADGFKLKDRGDNGFGGTLSGQMDFPNEWYLSAGGKASYSDREQSDLNDRRGIKMETQSDSFDLDPGIITMGSLKDTVYVKSAVKASASLRKVLNYSRYYFTFPISLRREGLYATYNCYTIDDFVETFRVNEMTLGVKLDTVILNSFPVPINVEYIHNDNPRFAKRDSARVFVDMAF